MLDAQNGKLPAVSFVKPVGEENEHPGYASEPNGSSHLVDLIKTILAGPEGKSTMIIVTYDEFGGQWDHVPPPGTDGQTRARTTCSVPAPASLRSCCRHRSAGRASITTSTTPRRSWRRSSTASVCGPSRTPPRDGRPGTRRVNDLFEALTD